MKFVNLFLFATFLFTACGSGEERSSRREQYQEANNLNEAEADEEEPNFEITTDEEAAASVITKESLAKFVPKGYVILDWKAGDLNRDDKEDVVLIIDKGKPAENATSTTGSTASSGNDDDIEEERLLILLTADANGDLRKVAENANVVLCSDCGGMMGDPYSAIAIKNGYFSIEHYGGSSWRWTRIITFKYSDKDGKWYLHRDGGDDYHASDPDKVTTKVKTKKDFGIVPFEKFNCEN